MCKKKMATSADLLCRYTPPAFRQFTEAVVNLKFDEEPRYSAYVPLFEPLCGPGPQRPILLEEKSRVGQKRGREAFEGEDVEIVSLWSDSGSSLAPNEDHLVRAWLNVVRKSSTQLSGLFCMGSCIQCTALLTFAQLLIEKHAKSGLCQVCDACELLQACGAQLLPSGRRAVLD